MKAERVIQALAALAQEHRLAAFRYLVQCGHGGAAAGAIADTLGIPASSLSFHLAQLERSGLIARIRKSRSLIYSADFAAMNALVGYLMENCCGGDACLPATECLLTNGDTLQPDQAGTNLNALEIANASAAICCVPKSL